MQKNKINLKKENYLYKLNIHHDELLKPFNFPKLDKLLSGEIDETRISTIVYKPNNKKEYEVALKLFQYVDGIFKEEFQIELKMNEETYQAFYTIDEDGDVYLTRYEYLGLVKIFEKIDYEVETNLMDLRVMGIDFLSNLLSTAFYQNLIFDYKMDEEDYKQTNVEIKDNKTVCYEDVIAQGLMDGKKIRIYDSEEDKEHSVRIYMLQKGFEILGEKFPKTYSNIIRDQYDSVDADMLIQCTLFGDVIYG